MYREQGGSVFGCNTQRGSGSPCGPVATRASLWCNITRDFIFVGCVFDECALPIPTDVAPRARSGGISCWARSSGCSGWRTASIRRGAVGAWTTTWPWPSHVSCTLCELPALTTYGTPRTEEGRGRKAAAQPPKNIRKMLRFGEMWRRDGSIVDAAEKGAKGGGRRPRKNAFCRNAPRLNVRELAHARVFFRLRGLRGDRKRTAMRKVFRKVSGFSRSTSTSEERRAAGEHDSPSDAVAGIMSTRRFSMSRFSSSSVQPTKSATASVSRIRAAGVEFRG